MPHKPFPPPYRHEHGPVKNANEVIKGCCHSSIKIYTTQLFDFLSTCISTRPDINRVFFLIWRNASPIVNSGHSHQRHWFTA